MDIQNIRWSYCIAKAGPDKEMEMEFSVGPIKEERIQEIVGTYMIMPLRDGTAIAVAHQARADLIANEHYPGLKGDILVGKLSDGVFVGAIGVAL